MLKCFVTFLMVAVAVNANVVFAVLFVSASKNILELYAAFI